MFVIGSGDCGQLGLGEEVLERSRPGKIAYFDDLNIVQVACGGLHNLALSQSGKVYSWGCNDQKALGREGAEMSPGPVEGLKNAFIVKVAAGDSVSVALTDKGRVFAWGTFRVNYFLMLEFQWNFRIFNEKVDSISSSFVDWLT